MILGCSLTSLYFGNNNSAYIIASVIIIFTLLSYKNNHRSKKMVLLCFVFTFCTTIISVKKTWIGKDRLEIIEKGKKEYHFKIINVCEKFIKSKSYLTGDIQITKPNSNIFENKSILIKNSKSLKRKNKKVLNICVNSENIKLSSNIVWIEKAHKLKMISLRNNNLKEYFENHLFCDKYDQSLAFGWAMLTGTKKFIHESDIKRYELSGTMHYFAVSGLHVGFLYLILSFLLKKLFVNNNLTLFVTFFICLLYIYIIDMPTSAVRALLMITIFYCCQNSLLKCKRIAFYCISLIIIILYDPMSIFSLSAQLSFNVVLFILFSIESSNLWQKEKWRFLNKLSSLFIISLAASAGSALLIFDVFRTFPYLSIITNLTFAPFIFIFYTINVVHVSCLLIFDFSFFTSFHKFFYYLLNYITIVVSNLSNLLPKLLSSNFNISPSVHIFLFFSFLTSFCFRLSSNVRLSVISIYYIIVWVSYYFLCD